jgi:transcriptional regulator
MLIRPHDAADDEARWRAFVADQAFGQLVAVGEGHDVAVVVPTQYVVTDDAILLHLASPNPIFERLAQNPRALLSVAGDWAYIPAAWKAIGDEDPREGVPTTFYAAVQLAGMVEIVDDPAELAEILRTQLAAFEPNSDVVDPIDHQQKFRDIRGLRLSIDEVRAKFKYGGNVDLPHRQAIEAQLDQRDGPGDSVVRRHMIS